MYPVPQSSSLQSAELRAERIAKSIALKAGDGAILVVAAGMPG